MQEQPRNSNGDLEQNQGRPLEEQEQTNRRSPARGAGFQSIGQILDGRGKNERTVTMGDCKCLTCNEFFQGEITTYAGFSPPRVIKANLCSECQRRQEEQERLDIIEEANHLLVEVRQTWLKRANLPQFINRTHFEQFDLNADKGSSPSFKKAYTTCKRWAENYLQVGGPGYPSLILYSDQAGVGKTTLMTCIANHLIQNWNSHIEDTITQQEKETWYNLSTLTKLKAPKILVRFESGPSLVRRVKATYDIPKDDKYHEREEDIYRELSDVRVLMLDDVGKEKPSDFTRELYWYIVDERLKRGLPLIISSRLPIDEDNPEQLNVLMGEDTVDRLFGMAKGRVTSIKADSYRRSNKIA